MQTIIGFFKCFLINEYFYPVQCRENKNMTAEVKHMLDRLGNGGRSIHYLDKQRRHLEAESAIEQKENSVLHAQLLLAQTK